jgi:hypothetical protein
VSEDQRGAVSLFATISGHLISAALAILAIEGGFLAYVLGNRIVNALFFVLAILTALLFVVSILIGGTAISRSAEAGFRGNWSLKSESQRYNWQAVLCLLGLVAFLGMAFLSGRPKESALEQEVSDLKSQAAKTTDAVGELQDSIDAFSTRLDSLLRD